MNNLKRFVLFFFLFPVTCAGAGEGWFSGWEKSVKGGNFQYHSPEPGIGSSLLIRSVDSAQYIEWLTQVVPAGANEHEVLFMWMFGIDANPDSHNYKVFLNGNFCLSFSNPVISEKKTWTVTGENGTRLTFRTTMIDKYDDLMGYASFSVPEKYILKGRSQTIRITGESAASRTWYMTFEAGVKERIDVEQQPAILRGEGSENLFCVTADVVHLGEPGEVVISFNGKKNTFHLDPGHNRYRLFIPESSSGKTENLTIAIPAKEVVQKQVRLEPVRKWKIHLIQHTHIDIGYTRPQTEILPEHLRYIDYALDYCDQTDSLPEDARFRWTCETSWAVDQYLKSRPAEQKERLRKRVAEGSIELTALYLNSSDLSDEPTIAESLQPVSFFRSNGFPVSAAMQNDINGVPWCLTDYLYNAGILFLNMGQNAERACKPFDRPTSFLWESPSGNRIMVNRAEHYMLGNTLGILIGREALEKNLFQHLATIAGKGYPYDDYSIQFSGYLIDNSPPSTTACRVVEEWNRVYVWPKLRFSTISGYLGTIRKDHYKELPVVRGAWPDWWMDGLGSAPLTTAVARSAHSDFIVNNGLLIMGKLLGVDPAPEMNLLNRQIADDLAFYDEHTFGAAESITDPDCENSVIQLGSKMSYAWDAVKKNRLLLEQIMGRMQSMFPTDPDFPVLTMINTAHHKRSGNIDLYLDRQVLPADRKFSIEDDQHRQVRIQLVRERPEGAYWTLFAEDVPAMGWKSCRIRVSDEPSVPAPPLSFTGNLESNWYILRADPETGKIISLFDKQENRELAGSDGDYAFGEPVYETLGKNREQIGAGMLQEYRRRSWDSVRVTGMAEGPLWKSLFINGKLPGCASPEGLTCEIRLYLLEKKTEFRYSMRKSEVRDPEGLYIAFPFAMNKNCDVFYEVAGGTVKAGTDQIAGSSTDWQGIQNFVSLKDEDLAITFVTPEIPLVHLGGINLGRFTKIPEKPLPVICSWVLNNYWTTNFLVSQPGELKWTYTITSGKAEESGFEECYSRDQRVPMVARVLPANRRKPENQDRISLMNDFPQNILLTGSRLAEDNQSIILNFRETAGKTTSVNFARLIRVAGSSTISEVRRVNVLDEPMGEPSAQFEIKPYENVFIQIMR